MIENIEKQAKTAEYVLFHIPKLLGNNMTVGSF